MVDNTVTTSLFPPRSVTIASPMVTDLRLLPTLPLEPRHGKMLFILARYFIF